MKRIVDDFIMSRDDAYRYFILGRLVADCEYYLGWGGRSPRRLYYHNVKDHIQAMRELYYSFENKPEWLSLEQINEYENEMLKGDGQCCVLN